MLTDTQPGQSIQIVITFGGDDGPSSERLWARYMGSGLAKVENIPYLAFEISEGDTVRVNEDLEVVEIVEKAAHTRGLRFSVPEDDEEAIKLANIITTHLEANSIHVEFSVPGFGSMAVPLGVSERQLQKICMECPVRVELYGAD
jgi:ornithine carbamoyltransferase